MILLDNITKYYPGDKAPALDGVSLYVQPKEFVFIVGRSGAGKSTLIKMLTREEVPTSGKIIVGGIDFDYMKKRHVPHLRRRIGVVFQDFKLLPNRTVYENVAFALEIVGVSNAEIRRTVPKVLELVGLADKGHKFPDELSGGERQRVAIARSMARQPKILIADEPTGNLDPENSEGIMQLLEEINNYGTTIMVTTHDENIVNKMKRRVVTLRGGKIIGDQKQGGHYELEAEKAVPVRRPIIATSTPRTRAQAMQRSVRQFQDAGLTPQQAAQLAQQLAVADAARQQIAATEPTRPAIRKKTIN